jgi:Na+-transporting NADH:ubiquinone oxidoreductase subunit NqrD
MHDREITPDLLVLVMLILSFPSSLLVFGVLLELNWIETAILGDGKHIAPVAFILLSWVAFFAVGYYQWFGRISKRATNSL